MRTVWMMWLAFAWVMAACTPPENNGPSGEDSEQHTINGGEDCDNPLPNTPLADDDRVVIEEAELELMIGSVHEDGTTVQATPNLEVDYPSFTVQNNSDQPTNLGAIELTWWYDSNDEGLHEPTDRLEDFLRDCYLKHIDGNRQISDRVTIEPGGSNADTVTFDMTSYDIQIADNSRIYVRPVCTQTDHMSITPERLTYELPGRLGGSLTSNAGSYRVVAYNNLPRAWQWVNLPYRDPQCTPHHFNGPSNLSPHAQSSSVAWPSMTKLADVNHGHSSTSDSPYGPQVRFGTEGGCSTIVYDAIVITFTDTYQVPLAMSSSEVTVTFYRSGEDASNPHTRTFIGQNPMVVWLDPSLHEYSGGEQLFMRATVDADTDHNVDDPNMPNAPEHLGMPAGTDHLTPNLEPWHMRFTPAWREKGNQDSTFGVYDNPHPASLVVEMSHD